MFSIRATETGDTIEQFETKQEAITKMEWMELDDMREGGFTVRFYEVYDEDAHEVVQTGVYDVDMTGEVDDLYHDWSERAKAIGIKVI